MAEVLFHRVRNLLLLVKEFRLRLLLEDLLELDWLDQPRDVVEALRVVSLEGLLVDAQSLVLTT